ncbi:helix-turn-helix domain-containing protein [Clostridium massiliodielmoense]|uniref:helix-turn-helix domain-containing protein n=1 Tax=Clostridium massiliodielmoense TaxID=1776385 RepID=UPI00069FEE78|nr:helix-turn-helix transcriptional regulator [Clostridium massiliodielmoense]
MALSKNEMGILIKKARTLKSKKRGKNYTQLELAKDIGISRSYLGDIESGRIYPNYILLNKISEACEIPFRFFDKKSLNDEPEDTLNLLEKSSKSTKSLAGRLIDILLEQDFFDNPEDIPEETINIIMKALKKDIERALKNKNK